MNDTVIKKVCQCENCGNEAEMIITCSLPSSAEDHTHDDAATKSDDQESKKQVKGTATCSQCGNEADMWIDL